MLSTQVFWWLALPLLLLPIWWHRQKRQRLKAEPLATARFLPSSAPQQLRVWQWSDRLLLLARCLLLVALIAWLAVTVFPWRGDTVLVDAGVDQAWADQQIRSAGFAIAARETMPADVLPWLHRHEHEWRGDAGARAAVCAFHFAARQSARGCWRRYKNGPSHRTGNHAGTRIGMACAVRRI
jgi:hypothetical protein